MNFLEFREKLKNNIDKMFKDYQHLYEIDADKDEFYQYYLDSYPSGSNEIFRTRREHDCSECRRFIKDIGLVVALKDGKFKSIWDFKVGDNDVYQVVADKLAEYVYNHAVINNVYMYRQSRVGVESNKELDESGKVFVWKHFYADIPDDYIYQKDLLETKRANCRDAADNMYKTLSEFSLESIDAILELITDDLLYRGNEHKLALETLRKTKVKFDKIRYDKMLFAWENFDISILRHLRNSSIGTLLKDINNGVDIETAVKKYEEIVAPYNYKRPKAIFTKRMLEDAKKTVEKLGYTESLGRRYATLDDINVNNVLFTNMDASTNTGTIDLFGELEKEAVINPKKIKTTDISIMEFVDNILPNSSSVEVLMEGRHGKNLMSLIAPINGDAPTMFKWDNAFSWAYNGNIADSDIKQNVKKAGGDTEGDVRFSIQWNDGERYDGNDLDAHCKEPYYEIYFGNRERTSPNGGKLDVDIIHPLTNVAAVENIIYKDKMKMKKGKYLFFVHVYSYRNGRSGFRAEIEIDGEVYNYDYSDVKGEHTIKVAELTCDGNGNINIKHCIKPVDTHFSSGDIWGVKTNTFTPVTTVMLSPNYWDDNAIGNKHYFFMLDGCKNPDTPNGWYNEYLSADLVTNHKRVFEALGSRAKVAESDNQLSGVGFSETQRNNVVIRVKNNNGYRVYNVKF